jgi:transposase
MEQQLKLHQYNKALFGSSVVSLRRNSHTLESEKRKFIESLISFIEPLNFDILQITGRPKSDMRTILMSLLVMAFNSMSYRRTQSDLQDLFDKKLIRKIIPRSTLNDYANDLNTKLLLEKLITLSALFFNDNENTLILDSTWLSTKMYVGGHNVVHDKTNANFKHTRKLHIGCLKNSRIICYAMTTAGQVHDSPVGREIIEKVAKSGFNLTSVLADAGYISKETYALCKELGILDTFINFKRNCGTKRGKSDLWQERVKMWKEHPEAWHEGYRYRVLVEGIFSAIKRKQQNWLRAKTDLAQDIELLLKCLVYNLTIIGKYS